MRDQSDTGRRASQNLPSPKQAHSTFHGCCDPTNHRQRPSSQYDTSASGTWATSQYRDAVDNHYSTLAHSVDASNSSSQIHSPHARLLNDLDQWQMPVYSDTMHDSERWSSTARPEVYDETNRSRSRWQYDDGRVTNEERYPADHAYNTLSSAIAHPPNSKFSDQPAQEALDGTLYLYRDHASYHETPSREDFNCMTTPCNDSIPYSRSANGSCRFPSHHSDSTLPFVDPEGSAVPLSLLSSLGSQFVHIPLGSYGACKTFVQQHPEIVDEGTAQYNAEAIFALRQRDETLAKSCLEKSMLLSCCGQTHTSVVRHMPTAPKTRRAFSETLQKALLRTKDLVAKDEEQGQQCQSSTNALAISTILALPHEWSGASSELFNINPTVFGDASHRNGLRRLSGKVPRVRTNRTLASDDSDAVLREQSVENRRKVEERHKGIVENKSQQEEQNAKHVRFRGEIIVQGLPGSHNGDVLRLSEGEKESDPTIPTVHDGPQQLQACCSRQNIPSSVIAENPDLGDLVRKVERTISRPRRQKAVRLPKQRQSQSITHSLGRRAEEVFSSTTPELNTTGQPNIDEGNRVDRPSSETGASSRQHHELEICQDSNKSVELPPNEFLQRNLDNEGGDKEKHDDHATKSGDLLISATSHTSASKLEVSIDEIQSQEEQKTSSQHPYESNDDLVEGLDKTTPPSTTSGEANQANDHVRSDGVPENQISVQAGVESIISEAVVDIEPRFPETAEQAPCCISSTPADDERALNTHTIQAIQSECVISCLPQRQEGKVTPTDSDGMVKQSKVNIQTQLLDDKDVTQTNADPIVKTKATVEMYTSADTDDSSATAVDTEEEEEDTFKAMISGRRKSWNNVRKLQAWVEGLHMRKEELARRTKEVEIRANKLKDAIEDIEDEREKQRQKRRELMEIEERLTFEKEKLHELKEDILNTGTIIVGVICIGLLSVYSTYRL